MNPKTIGEVKERWQDVMLAIIPDDCMERAIEIMFDAIDEASSLGKPKSCKWALDSDCSDEFHSTQCGEAHCFIVEGIKENKYKYCPYCGGKIVELPTPPQEKDGK